MGIKIDWKKLALHDPKLILVLPVETVWVEDPTLPRFGAVLCDMTATMQQMNFTGCGQSITSGAEFERRIIKKIVSDNLRFGAEHIALLWDKPWTTQRRAEMYAKKRYTIPAAFKEPPAGKIRAHDGRFYAPSQAPLPQFDPSTNFGVKAADVITKEKMYPLPQLLNAAWTKVQVAAFMCRCLWEFAKDRPEHIMFDTPFLKDDPLCDGLLKCNHAACQLCPAANIPRHGEADLLYLYHIRHLAKLLPVTSHFMARGSNDRDLLVVLAFPFDIALANRIWWCKGTGQYAIAPSGKYVLAGKTTGLPQLCHEFIRMKKVVTMFAGENNKLLLTRLFLLFFFGGDYCETPNGITETGLFKSLFACQMPIITLDDESAGQSLHLNTSALHRFIQHAKDGSIRSRSLLTAENLLKTTYDAFYSLAYYTACHKEFSNSDVKSQIGPDLSCFSYNTAGYVLNKEVLELFKPMMLPFITSRAENSNFIEYTVCDM
jgi:hypothetical protein